MGDSRPVGGHEIGGVHAAEGDHVLIAAAVAHHADGFHRENGGEGLGGAAIEVLGNDFFEEDFVGIPQNGEAVFGDFAEAADGEAGAGEGVSPDDFLGQAELQAELADFVFEQVAQRLDEVEAELGRETADVVVKFNVGGGFSCPPAWPSGRIRMTSG